MEYHSFTNVHPRLLRELVTDAKVKKILSDAPKKELRNYRALWDTGAGITSITKKVVDECQLVAIGKIDITGVNGTSRCNLYLIELYLPNGVYVPELPVAESQGILGDNIDLLIGMDIISLGDFAVNNYNGRTSFTFRIPSKGVLDFAANNKRVGRNDPCPCGSEQKYKNCHGHR